MTRPGVWLRALAARVCNAGTMARVIDPVVADLQLECQDAERHGRIWKRRWIHLTGCVGLVKAVGLHGCARLAALPSEWTAEDQHALRGSMTWFLGAVLGITFLMVLPALLRIPSMAGHLHSITPFQTSEFVFFVSFITTLIPSTVPVALPAGLLFAIFCGLGNQAVSHRLRLAVLGVAFAASLVSFAAWTWVIPALNQAFGVVVYGGGATPTINELTLGDLGRRLDSVPRGELSPAAAAQLAMTYHAHWAFASASLALAILALVLISRWRIRRAFGGAIACIVLSGYFLLLWAGRVLGLAGMLSPIAAVWVSSLAAVLLAASIMVVGPPRRFAASSGRSCDM